MSYMAAQALLKTLISTVPALASSTVEGNPGILDAGVSNACILMAGALPPRNIAIMAREVYWEAFADLITRFSTDSNTAYNDFGTLRDSVIAAIEAAPCMSATYFIIEIQSDGDPEEIEPFIMQRLRITIQENV